MNLDLYNQKAKKVGTVEAEDSIFGAKVNDKVLAQYVYIYLSNQRQSNANTKDRSDVRGGGKKPWKQKGTGRARVGSNRSPLWKGGGVTFGPTNEVNWKRKTTKTFRAASFRSAFSKLNKDGLISVIEKLEFDKKNPLTKQAVTLKKDFDTAKKITIVTAVKNDDLLKAFANLKNSNIVLINELSAYDLLNGGKVLLEKETLDYINSHWAKKVSK